MLQLLLVLMAIWEDQLKTEHCILLDCSYEPNSLSILAIGVELLPTLNKHRVGNRFHYAGLYVDYYHAI